MTVEIVIDEVVLRGVPDAEAGTVAAALEARLAALAAGAIAAAGGDGGLRSAVRGGVRVAPRRRTCRDAADLGGEVASALWWAVTGDGQ